MVLGCFSVCSPSVLLDLPVGISWPCFCSALSSSLVFVWYPLSREVGLLARVFCDWGFDTDKVTLHHCLLVDSLLLMPFVLWVTWEAPLRKLDNVLCWRSRPLLKGFLPYPDIKSLSWRSKPNQAKLKLKDQVYWQNTPGWFSRPPEMRRDLEKPRGPSLGGCLNTL